jgi:hypothetical protein
MLWDLWNVRPNQILTSIGLWRGLFELPAAKHFRDGRDSRTRRYGIFDVRFAPYADIR